MGKTMVKSDRKARRSFRGLRLGVLVGLLVVATGLGILHQVSGGLRPVGVDALCPFGGIEAAFTLVASGTLLEKIAWSSFVLLLAVVITAVAFRRVFCGKICAFGALQELFGRLGRRLFGRREVPAAIDRPARRLKYLALAAVVAFSAALGTLAIRPYDPWAAWNHLLSAELTTGFLVGLIVLAVSLAGSLVYDRFFCKYLCPMGAFLGLINRIGWFRVRRNEATCTHCNACDKACPVNIRVEAVTEVKSAECISCNLCVAACPVKDTLVVEGPKPGSRRVSPTAVLGITLGVFLAVIGVSTALGASEWTVKSLSERAAEGARETGGAGTAAAGGEAAALDPQAIKGSDTFRQVIDLFGVPQADLMARFGLSAGDVEKPMRESAHRAEGGFEVQEVRDFVAEKTKR